jgi:hypothetical protein
MRIARALPVVAALEELTGAVLADDAHLFSIRPTVQRVTWQFGANDYPFGQRHVQTPNEPAGISTVVWSTRRPGPARGSGASTRPVAGTAVDQLFPLGRYTVTPEAGGARRSRPALIVKTQGWPLGGGAAAETIRKR